MRIRLPLVMCHSMERTMILYDNMGRVRNDMEGCQHAVRLDLWAGLQETKEGKEAHPEWSRSSL